MAAEIALILFIFILAGLFYYKPSPDYNTETGELLIWWGKEGNKRKYFVLWKKL